MTSSSGVRVFTRFLLVSVSTFYTPCFLLLPLYFAFAHSLLPLSTGFVCVTVHLRNRFVEQVTRFILNVSNKKATFIILLEAVLRDRAAPSRFFWPPTGNSLLPHPRFTSFRDIPSKRSFAPLNQNYYNLNFAIRCRRSKYSQLTEYTICAKHATSLRYYLRQGPRKGIMTLYTANYIYTYVFDCGMDDTGLTCSCGEGRKWLLWGSRRKKGKEVGWISEKKSYDVRE